MEHPVKKGLPGQRILKDKTVFNRRLKKIVASNATLIVMVDDAILKLNSVINLKNDYFRDHPEKVSPGIQVYRRQVAKFKRLKNYLLFIQDFEVFLEGKNMGSTYTLPVADTAKLEARKALALNKKKKREKDQAAALVVERMRMAEKKKQYDQEVKQGLHLDKFEKQMFPGILDLEIKKMMIDRCENYKEMYDEIRETNFPRGNRHHSLHNKFVQ